MSITDLDLQFMADSLLDDALLPDDDGNLSLAELLSADLHVESAGDTVLEPKSTDAPKASKGKGKTKIDWKRSANPASGAGAAATPVSEIVDKGKAGTKEKSTARTGDKSGAKPSVAADAAQGEENSQVAAQDKAKEKAKTPQSTSPLSDFYLSSLPASLVRPKLSKSMKGASQNDQQALASEADKMHESNAISAPDPYGIPTSPTLRPRQDKPAQKTKTTSPAMSIAKITSPLGLIPASNKKPPKPQKRVAKRSILDAPETLEEETVKPAPVSRPSKAPSIPSAPKQTAKSKRKQSTGKEKKEKENMPAPVKGKKEKEKETPAAKPTKTDAKARKQVPRSFFVPKQANEEAPKKVKEEKDSYEIPASFDVPPREEVTKKLRPRVEKPAIIISSDSETSYSDDDDFSETGDTTVMTTPDDIASNAGAKQLRRAKLSAGVNLNGSEGTVASKSLRKPVVEERGESSKSTTLQPQTTAMSPEFGKVTSASLAVKRAMGEPISASGPDALVSGQGPSQQMARTGKRQRSPAKEGREGDQKRSKPGHGPTTAHGRGAEDADTDRVPRDSQGSSSKVVHSVAASDPFVGDVDDKRPQQSHFTAKLLQSAAHSVNGMDSQPLSRPPDHRGHSRLAVATPVPTLKESPIITSEPSQIASEMMRLLATSRQAEADRAQTSPKEIWLNETGPYNETGQAMSYVCKTLLRFLKSKESAIDDVATEYRQRGSALLTRIKDLHKEEMATFAVNYENRRQKSLDAFEEACRGVRQLSERLERMSLVPAINTVLADNTAARLRALQAEIV